MSRNRRALRGLTLVEVLVAIAIFAMVAVVVFGGFSQTMINKRIVEDEADRTHVIRVALERMVNELSMAYVSMHVNPDPSLQVMNTCFIGGRANRGHRIDFTSFSHRRLYRDAHESDQNELSYFITNDPEDKSKFVLARRHQNRIDEDPQTGGTIQVMLRDVLRFEAEYLDGVTGEWVDRWDSRDLSHQPNRLPIQVKLKLTVVDEDAPNRERTYVTRAQPMITWALNHAIY